MRTIAYDDHVIAVSDVMPVVKGHNIPSRVRDEGADGSDVVGQRSCPFRTVPDKKRPLIKRGGAATARCD